MRTWQSDPRLKYVPASVRGQWDPAKLREKTSPEELAALKAEAARDVELVKAMHGAGVQFMAGSDGPDPYVFPGFSLHDELEWLVKSGFTPLQALQSATFNPALFHGQHGQIRSGGAGARGRSGAAGREPARRHPQHAQDFWGGRRRQILFAATTWTRCCSRSRSWPPRSKAEVRRNLVL